ncbi:hypothetical protein HDV57DRAFT_130959 [Trichoderma longibrachiatum]
MARPNPAAITPAPSQEPFTIQPIIRDMLGTRRCTSNSVFIVEGINNIPVPAATPDDDDTYAVRLVLGDGELCIQALLHPDMFQLVEKRDVFVGCYVKVKDLILRFEEPEDTHVGRGFLDDDDEEDEKKKEEGDEQTMVYLILNDLETIGWNESYMAMWRRHEKGKDVEEPAAAVSSTDSVKEKPAPENNLVATPSKETKATPTASTSNRGAVRFADPQTPTKIRYQDKGKAKASTPAKNRGDNAHGEVDEDDLEDVFEAFEARTFPARNTTPKKPAAPRKHAASAASGSTDKSQQQQQQQQQPQHMQPVALPKDWHDPQVPLKLTTLRLIPHLPYAQNWSVNVLAIVTSLSAVEPSHLPPGKQRTARIADPSTAKQVHLTVFLDPEEFTPKVGSAVLLVGVKNHRFDGGSLKKYASDGNRDIGRRWWFEDPWELAWLNVAGIKSWWQSIGEGPG